MSLFLMAVFFMPFAFDIAVVSASAKAEAEAAAMSKAKGIKKTAIRNKDIRHEDYKHVLEGTKDMPDYPNTSIRSNKHKLEIMCQHKKSLAVGDTKRIFQSKEKSFALGITPPDFES